MINIKFFFNGKQYNTAIGSLKDSVIEGAKNSAIKNFNEKTKHLSPKNNSEKGFVKIILKDSQCTYEIVGFNTEMTTQLQLSLK